MADVSKAWSWLGHVRTRRPQRYSAPHWWRRRIGALTLLVLLIAMVAGFLHFTNPARIRLQAMAALGELTGGEVALDEASLMIWEGIRIKGLKVFPPGGEHIDDNVVFAAQDVILEHRAVTILLRRLVLRKIVAQGPRLRIVYDRDKGIANLQRFHFLSGMKRPSEYPAVVLRDAKVEYQERFRGEDSGVAEQVMSGELRPDPCDRDVYQFELRSAADGLLKGSVLEGRYNLRSTRLETEGRFSLEKINLQGLPERVSAWQQKYVIDPSGDVTTSSSYDPQHGHNVRLTLSNGSLRVPVHGTLLPLEKVEAKLAFTNEALRIEHMSAEYGPQCHLYAEGTIDSYTQETGFRLQIHTEGLVIPQAQWQTFEEHVGHGNIDTSASKWEVGKATVGTLLPGLTESACRWPVALRRVVSDYRPTGKLDVELELSRRAGEDGDPAYRGTVHCKDAAGCYHGFPYALTGIEGTIAFSPGEVIFGPLKARSDENRTTISGRWNHTAGASNYEVTVRSDNLPLDKKLYDALPAAYRQQWDQFNPVGQADILYERTGGDDSQASGHLVIELNATDISYVRMPVPLTEAFGRVDWQDGRAVFKIDQGRALGGTVGLAGEIVDSGSDAGQWHCDITFEDIVLEEGFGDLLPDAMREFYEQAGFVGRADGEAQLSQTGQVNPGEPSEDVNVRVRARLHDGRMLPTAFAYELSDVAGTIEITPQQLRIEKLEGRHKGGDLSLQGTAEAADEYRLRVEASDLALDEKLQAVLGQGGVRLWESLNPAGKVDMVLETEHTRGAAEPTYEARITALGCQLRPGSFDYLFDGVHGSIAVRPGEVVIEELTSESGPMKVSLSGKITRGDETTAYGCALSLKGQSVPLDANLRAALPRRLSRMVEELDVAGELDFGVDVDRQLGQEHSNEWNCRGWAAVRDGGVEEPLRLTEIEAGMTGQAFYDSASDVLNLSGKLTASRLLFKKNAVTNATAQINYRGSENIMTVSDVSGYAAGGRLTGEGQVQSRESVLGYDLGVSLLGMDLKNLVDPNGQDDQWKENINGQVGGNIRLTGEGSKQQRRGSFVFAVRDGVLGELPIAAQVLHVFNLSLPRQGAFNEADVVGSIVGEDIVFEDLCLRGSAVSMVGKGMMTGANDELTLVFELQAPEYLASVPLLRSFVNAFVSPALMQVRVTGTFDSPNVEQVALPSLEEAFRQFKPAH